MRSTMKVLSSVLVVGALAAGFGVSTPASSGPAETLLSVEEAIDMGRAFAIRLASDAAATEGEGEAGDGVGGFGELFPAPATACGSLRNYKERMGCSFVACDEAAPCFGCVPGAPGSIGLPFPRRRLATNVGVQYGGLFQTGAFTGDLSIVTLVFYNGVLLFSDIVDFRNAPANHYGFVSHPNQLLPAVPGNGIILNFMLDGTFNILDVGFDTFITDA